MHVSVGDSSLVRRGPSPNSLRVRNRVMVSNRVRIRNKDGLHLWLWRTMAMVDWNLNKFGLVPLRTSDQSPLARFCRPLGTGGGLPSTHTDHSSHQWCTTCSPHATSNLQQDVIWLATSKRKHQRYNTWSYMHCKLFIYCHTHLLFGLVFSDAYLQFPAGTHYCFHH